ncbi:hypothetical protein [Streptomyces sp. NPDC001068]|uniref:hypothetical protein n=1 Tax=Streptomyces sp. NPDC001068 TaxID=3364544 RepID=UPI00367659BD
MPAHIPADNADAWLQTINPHDALRVIAAWDRLRYHAPDPTHLSPSLHALTRIPVQRIYDLQSVRNTCAHPLRRPLTQKDLVRVLATARALRARL